LRKAFLLAQRARFGGWVALIWVLLAAPGCAVRRTTLIPPSQLPSPAREASLAELIAKVNAQSEAIQTLVATVDLEPTAGSVYSGVIKEYRDVRGFILLEKPARIRMIGQAPVVRTNIFDMVSDGQEFRLYIPPKQKFIVGKTEFRRPAKNSLENLRPQHILDALLVPSLDSTREKYVLEEAEDGGQRYYVVSVLEPQPDGELSLKRKVWFDRSALEVVRLQIYGPHGARIEDVAYSGYEDYQTVRYPSRIEISRPVEDYRLSITVVKATFNQPIAPEKFELKKPEGAELVELGAARGPEVPRGQ
jgi:outer membrane lipoprotein-sorting protein